MSFKINRLGARIVKAKSICQTEQIVTVLVMLVILGVFTYPMYFEKVSIYFIAIAMIKLILVAVIMFDLWLLIVRLLKRLDYH